MCVRPCKLKITAVHCVHFSTHLVTGDGREDALVRPDNELSVTILNISCKLGYIQPTDCSARSFLLAEDRGDSDYDDAVCLR